MELRRKLKLIRTENGYTQAKFAEFIGIPVSTYKKYELGDSEVAISAFLKIADKFPNYALWLSTGEVSPEVGQTAPGEKVPKMGHAGVPAELLNSAFERTITASISLGWLSAKPDIKFSMLADLFRHDFVEVGGVLSESASSEDESQAG